MNRLFKNKKGEVTLQGFIISSLTAFLFIAVIGIKITMLGSDYDATGFNMADLEKYDKTSNITEAVNDAYASVDQVTVDKTVFDYLGDVWSKVIAPFKFIYRSFTTMIGLTNTVTQDLKLLSIFADYLSAVLTVLIIVGIVLIKFYMGRQK